MTGDGEDACVRIVRTRMGAMTGETIYETEDGATWSDGWRPVESSTMTAPGSVRRGYLNNGSICPHPPEDDE